MIARIWRILLLRKRIGSSTHLVKCAMVSHDHPREACSYPGSHRPSSGTACWPCRQRKVKCDNQSPCENCVKREHPQLCSYRPNRTSGGGKSTSPVLQSTSVTRKRERSPEDQDRRSLSNEGSSDQNLKAYGTCRGA